jgi:hypothetical protein
MYPRAIAATPVFNAVTSSIFAGLGGKEREKREAKEEAKVGRIRVNAGPGGDGAREALISYAGRGHLKAAGEAKIEQLRQADKVHTSLSVELALGLTSSLTAAFLMSHAARDRSTDHHPEGEQFQ